MPQNVPAVWISNNSPHSGWMDLNRFLASGDVVERWQVLYCLTMCRDLVYLDVRMQCSDHVALQDWMREWENTDWAQQIGVAYCELYLPPGFHPMQLPRPEQLPAI